MISLSKKSRQAYWLLSVTGIVLGIFLSYRMRWLGDDIFIALRYVQHFNEGHGLVYNAGERVEGYTDFLWLLLIAFFAKLNFDPAAVTEILGIVFSTATMVLFSVIGFKVARQKNKFIFPFISLALVFNYDYYVWATGGLEVSFVTFLVSAAFYLYFFTEWSFNKRLLFAGFFICLALMTRPDVMLILLFLNFLLFVRNIITKTSIADLIKVHCLFNAAVMLIYLPYFLWRYHYYGFIFPNTYYDKLGDETAFAQGFYYIWLYFKCHFTTFLFLLPLFMLFPLIRKEGIKNFLLNKAYAPLYVSFSVILVYLVFFVARVGGDFMYARFIMLCVPFISFIILCSLALMDLRYLNSVLLFILLLSGAETYIRKTMFVETAANGKEGMLFPRGIADERYCYLYFGHIEEEVQRGKELNAYLKDIRYKAVIFGAQARFAYYADFDYCQEYFGLTDTLIAHSVIKERGRIGHEKHGTVDYFESKQIHFSFNASPFKEDAYRFAHIDLPAGQLSMEIITYDNAIINKISQRLGKDFTYVDFPQYLDTYIADSLALKPPEQLRSDFQKFYVYYFKNNKDQGREKAFREKLKN